MLKQLKRIFLNTVHKTESIQPTPIINKGSPPASNVIWLTTPYQVARLARIQKHRSGANLHNQEGRLLLYKQTIKNTNTAHTGPRLPTS